MPKNARRTAECVAQGGRDRERTSQHTQEDLSGKRVESKDPLSSERNDGKERVKLVEPKKPPTPQKNVLVRWANIPNRVYRLCSEASALGERSSRGMWEQSERDEQLFGPLVQFSHRLYLMLNSVLVVAISDSSTSTEGHRPPVPTAGILPAAVSVQLCWEAVCHELQTSIFTNLRYDLQISSNSKGEQSPLFPVSCPVTVHETPIPLKVLITQIGTLAGI